MLHLLDTGFNFAAFESWTDASFKKSFDLDTHTFLDTFSWPGLQKRFSVEVESSRKEPKL